MYTEMHELGTIADEVLQFAVIMAKCQDKWVFVKHKLRETWEIPGGHREPGEPINQTAARELWEETGARVFCLQPICDYSVTREEAKEASFGRLFRAEVEEFAQLPESEIRQVALFASLPKQLTYPEIQPLLFQRAVGGRGTSTR